ncbi:MAG TPA: RNA-binding protein, partial [Ruminococcus sp.]|nr:RNA-binding protein [Ruminococcus sp.]
VDVFENLCFPEKINYFINSGRLDRWEYSTKESGRMMVSVF